MYYVQARLVYSGKIESGASFFFCSSGGFFFFGVSFPVFTESGEEQHFLRGKPAFRSLRPAGLEGLGGVGGGGGGDALSPIYVFHPAPCKHPA